MWKGSHLNGQHLKGKWKIRSYVHEKVMVTLCHVRKAGEVKGIMKLCKCAEIKNGDLKVTINK